MPTARRSVEPIRPGFSHYIPDNGRWGLRAREEPPGVDENPTKRSWRFGPRRCLREHARADAVLGAASQCGGATAWWGLHRRRRIRGPWAVTVYIYVGIAVWLTELWGIAARRVVGPGKDLRDQPIGSRDLHRLRYVLRQRTARRAIGRGGPDFRPGHRNGPVLRLVLVCGASGSCQRKRRVAVGRDDVRVEPAFPGRNRRCSGPLFWTGRSMPRAGLRGGSQLLANGLQQVVACERCAQERLGGLRALLDGH